MKITTIKYTEEFNYHGASQWVGLGAEIIEGEDVKKNLYELQKMTRDFFYESSKAAEKQMGVKYSAGEDTSISLSGVADLIKQINSCTELKILESYKFIVRNDEDLQTAYDKMSIKLNLKQDKNGN